MDGEIPTTIIIGDESVPIVTSQLRILEEETRVRLNGIFEVHTEADPGLVLDGILVAFGFYQILLRKGWLVNKGNQMINQYRRKVIRNSKDGIYEIDYITSTEII